MGDTRREMDRDIDDNQSVNIINFGFYKNNIFSVTDDKSEQTQIGTKQELFSYIVRYPTICVCQMGQTWQTFPV